MNKFITLSIISIVLLAGCADTHKTVNLSNNDFTKLNINDGIYIAMERSHSPGHPSLG